MAENDSKPAKSPSRQRRRSAASDPLALIEQNFASLVPEGEALAARFYERLFANYPKLKPLFSHVSVAGQQKKLLASLVLLVQNLRNPDVMNDYLKGLGARHQQYGVIAEYYPPVKENLLAVLEEFSSEQWHPELARAWHDVLDNVMNLMLDAYESADDEAINESENDAPNADDEWLRIGAAINGAMTAMMMLDRNFNITYVNKAASDMLRQAEPGFSAEQLIGSNIDIFVKDSSHQSRLLANAENVPYSTDISIGPLQFRLNFTAIITDDGRDIGSLLEWADITEQKMAEQELGAVVTAVQRGEINTRFDAERYQGAMKIAANGINNLLDAVGAPIEDSICLSQALAQGDLTQSIENNYAGIFGDLTQTMNQSVAGLARTVNEINRVAESVVKVVSEISQGSHELSQQTEQQASALEQTAASMQALTSTIRQNADNAKQATQMAVAARQQAEKTCDLIQQVIKAMAEINAYSKKIADSTSVIDDFAFHSKILALNAAVEAARAGDQGRGFAVVAAEIRNLAQRAAAGAKEVKSLINDSDEKLREGTTLVNESGKTLEDIVEDAQKVGDIIAGIAAVGDGQTRDVEQVISVISQMDKLSLHNATLLKQAITARLALDEQGRHLQHLISFFNTGQKT